MQTTLVLTFTQDVTHAFVESLTQDQVRPSCLHIELRRSYARHPLFASLMRYTENTPSRTPSHQAFLDLLDRHDPALAQLFHEPFISLNWVRSIYQQPLIELRLVNKPSH